MIVDSGSCELIIAFSDADMQRFVEPLIERGQERGCLSGFRWRSVRDPRRDSLVAHPELLAEAMMAIPGSPRLVVIWDHVGSGREALAAADVEAEVAARIERRGWPAERVAAIAVEPEFEALLVPTWARVKALLGQKRGLLPQSDSEVLGMARRLLRYRQSDMELPPLFGEALRLHPKELLDGLISLLNLRASPELFADLGRQLSIPGLKGREVSEPDQEEDHRRWPAGRLSELLESWFPGGQDGHYES